MTTLDPSIVDETTGKIERLTEQFRFQEARELAHFLEDRDTSINITALYDQIDRAEAAHIMQQRPDRVAIVRNFMIDRALGFGIAAFFLVMTGSVVLPVCTVIADWVLNFRQRLSLQRVVVTVFVALGLYVLAAIIFLVFGLSL